MMTAIEFRADRNKCTLCGLCVSDCPANIIVMGDNGPAVLLQNEASCYRCQHCLAICPVGAVSILGLDSKDSLLLSGNLPSAAQMETLIKGRRSIRSYKDENLDPAVIQKLLAVAWHAPSAKNDRKVRPTVVDDRAILAKLREQALAGIERLAVSGKLPAGMKRFADFPKLWAEKKIDILFRGAPHLLVASAPKNAVAPVADCFIALAYFELYAQSQGVGTVWDGLFKWTMDMLPEIPAKMGIPADHQIGYAMAFGRPAVKFTRTVQHVPVNIYRVA